MQTYPTGLILLPEEIANIFFLTKKYYMKGITTSQSVHSTLENKKYAIIPKKEFIIPERLNPQKKQFKQDWEKLGKDNYLKNGRSFRSRRFRYFYFLPVSGEILPFAPTPYYQPAEINKYAGDIDRKFDALKNKTINNPFFQELIRFDFRQLPVSQKAKSDPWMVDIHQIRTVATTVESGEPTPEGMHHDENDFVWIHLINRKNVTGGINGIYSNDRKPIGSCTLDKNMDSIVLWDPKVMHVVTSIHPKDPTKNAIRDVLLIGFTHCPGLQPPTGNPVLDYKEIKANINPPALLELES